MNKLPNCCCCFSHNLPNVPFCVSYLVHSCISSSVCFVWNSTRLLNEMSTVPISSLSLALAHLTFPYLHVFSSDRFNWLTHPAKSQTKTSLLHWAKGWIQGPLPESRYYKKNKNRSACFIQPMTALCSDVTENVMNRQKMRWWREDEGRERSRRNRGEVGLQEKNRALRLCLPILLSV